jgi:hypothetical protein
VGSFALSSDKTDLFAVALGTFLDIIKDVLNRFAVPRLFALNGFPVENLPEITHDDIETPNLGELASYIQTLTGAGVPMFPDEDLETYLREIAGLPPKSEEAKKAQEEQRQEEQPDETGTGEVEEDVEPGSDPAGSAAGSGGGSAARDAIAAARASRAG